MLTLTVLPVASRTRTLSSYCIADSNPRLGLPCRNRPVRVVSSNAASTRYCRSGGWENLPMLATNVAPATIVETATRGLKALCDLSVVLVASAPPGENPSSRIPAVKPRSFTRACAST